MNEKPVKMEKVDSIAVFILEAIAHHEWRTLSKLIGLYEKAVFEAIESKSISETEAASAFRLGAKMIDLAIISRGQEVDKPKNTK